MAMERLENFSDRVKGGAVLARNRSGLKEVVGP